MISKDRLWVEKYRPEHISDMIFPSKAVKEKFQAWVQAKNIPNLLLYGRPGTGKSSVSGVLLNDLGIHPDDVLRVNCSKDKIDAMRDRVEVFARSFPIGDMKVVQLEELGGLSLDGQKLLRSTIEDVSNSCRFIATANELPAIIPALQSRFSAFNFSTPDFDQAYERLADILINEGVNFEPEDFDKLVTATYPDIRQTLIALQSASATGTLVITEDATQDWKYELIPLITNGQWTAARELVCKTANKDELTNVISFLYKHLPKDESYGKRCILLGEYQYRMAFVSDQEIQIAAMFYQLAEA